jgi:hypothetical protein
MDKAPNVGQSKNQVVKQLVTNQNGRAVASHEKALSLIIGVYHQRDVNLDWIKPKYDDGREHFAGWDFDNRSDSPIDGPEATAENPYILYVKQRDR